MESSRAIVDSEKYFVVSISALIELSGCAMIKFE